MTPNRCPDCGARQAENAKFCDQCGFKMPPQTAQEPLSMFLSYGREPKEVSDFAYRLATELNRRKRRVGVNTRNAQVWIDQDGIKLSADWELSIEQGVNAADHVVFFATPHAVRRGGYCLNELSWAMDIRTPILTVLLMDSQLPPFLGGLECLDWSEQWRDPEQAPLLADELLDALQTGNLLKVGRTSGAKLDSGTSVGSWSEMSREKEIYLIHHADQHPDLVARLRTDLEARGHKILLGREPLETLFDQQGEAGQDSFTSQSAASSLSRVALILMSPAAVNRPKGTCLNDVSIACSLSLAIAPLMVEKCRPPMSIHRIQFLTVDDCIPLIEREANYLARFAEILNVLESTNDHRAYFDGLVSRLEGTFRPPAFGAELDYHTRKFTGRENLAQEIDNWLTSDDSPRVFFISGTPGAGKTAVIAHICQTRKEVLGYHLCRKGHSEKGDALACVRSLAFQIAVQIPAYADQLLRYRWEDIQGMNALTAFDTFLVEHLKHVQPPEGGRHLLVIDALDEAGTGWRNPLAEFIADHFDKMPPWIHLLVTGRPEPHVLQPMRRLTTREIDLHQLPETQSDIRNYVSSELRRITKQTPATSVVEALVARSEGAFLYAVEVLQQVQAGTLPPDRPEAFPKGLSEAYRRFFQQRFEDLEVYSQKLRPLLELLLAIRSDLTLEFAAKVLSWDGYAQSDVIHAFGSWLRIEGTYIHPSHGLLLEWVADRDKAGEFFADPIEGHRRLAESDWNDYQRGPHTLSNYGVAHLPYHLFEVGIRTKNFDSLYALADDTSFHKQRSRQLDYGAWASQAEIHGLASRAAALARNAPKLLRHGLRHSHSRGQAYTEILREAVPTAESISSAVALATSAMESVRLQLSCAIRAARRGSRDIVLSVGQRFQNVRQAEMIQSLPPTFLLPALAECDGSAPGYFLPLLVQRVSVVPQTMMGPSIKMSDEGDSVSPAESTPVPPVTLDKKNVDGLACALREASGPEQRLQIARSILDSGQTPSCGRAWLVWHMAAAWRTAFADTPIENEITSFVGEYASSLRGKGADGFRLISLMSGGPPREQPVESRRPALMAVADLVRGPSADGSKALETLEGVLNETADNSTDSRIALAGMSARLGLTKKAHEVLSRVLDSWQSAGSFALDEIPRFLDALDALQDPGAAEELLIAVASRLDSQRAAETNDFGHYTAAVATARLGVSWTRLDRHGVSHKHYEDALAVVRNIEKGSVAAQAHFETILQAVRAGDVNYGHDRCAADYSIDLFSPDGLGAVCLMIEAANEIASQMPRLQQETLQQQSQTLVAQAMAKLEEQPLDTPTSISPMGRESSGPKNLDRHGLLQELYAIGASGKGEAKLRKAATVALTRRPGRRMEEADCLADMLSHARKAGITNDVQELESRLGKLVPVIASTQQPNVRTRQGYDLAGKCRLAGCVDLADEVFRMTLLAEVDWFRPTLPQRLLAAVAPDDEPGLFAPLLEQLVGLHVNGIALDASESTISAISRLGGNESHMAHWVESLITSPYRPSGASQRDWAACARCLGALQEPQAIEALAAQLTTSITELPLHFQRAIVQGTVAASLLRAGHSRAAAEQLRSSMSEAGLRDDQAAYRNPPFPIILREFRPVAKHVDDAILDIISNGLIERVPADELGHALNAYWDLLQECRSDLDIHAYVVRTLRAIQSVCERPSTDSRRRIQAFGTQESPLAQVAREAVVELPRKMLAFPMLARQQADIIRLLLVEVKVHEWSRDLSVWLALIKNCADVLLELGDHSGARRLLDDCVEMVKKVNLEPWARTLLMAKLVKSFSAIDTNRAESLLQNAANTLETAEPSQQFQGYLELAKSLLALGHKQQALEVADKLVRLLPLPRNQRWSPELWQQLGEFIAQSSGMELLSRVEQIPPTEAQADELCVGFSREAITLDAVGAVDTWNRIKKPSLRRSHLQTLIDKAESPGGPGAIAMTDRAWLFAGEIELFDLWLSRLVPTLGPADQEEVRRELKELAVWLRPVRLG